MPWRHNARAYLDVGYWAAELIKPLLAKATNHATDPNSARETTGGNNRGWRMGSSKDNAASLGNVSGWKE